jgi:hypothetical protein
MVVSREPMFWCWVVWFFGGIIMATIAFYLKNVEIFACSVFFIIIATYIYLTEG